MNMFHVFLFTMILWNGLMTYKLQIINCYGNKCRACDDNEWCSACNGDFDDEIYIEKWLKKTINIKYIPNTSIISTEI